MTKPITHYLIIVIVLLCFSCDSKDQQNGKLSLLIERGDYSVASNLINDKLEDKFLTETQRREFLHQLDMMSRIEREFSLTEADVIDRLSKYFGDSTTLYMPKWEADKSLEFRLINGQKKYFRNGVSNLFRVDEFAKARKEKLKGKCIDPLNAYCLDHTTELVKKTNGEGELINPVNNVFDYTIKLKADAVPAGETIRCWMPYPKENHARQQNVEFISINSEHYTIAPDSLVQRSIYCEKIAEAGKETIFNVKFKTISFAQVFFPEKMKLKEYDKTSKIYIENTKERAPQIVFTDRIKKLADEICGDETDPLKQVDLLYNWIDINIPWASALEYGIMPHIPGYVLDNKHGDCGMQTLLFMSMARYRGIPVKWQSGFMLHPELVNLHDWCEVYYEGIGWVPLDQSFEMQKSEDNHVRHFYKTGIDAYRLIVNDDFSREFYPKKNWPRSEPIDFQRGELEWNGGNLYFSDWSYKMKVSYE
ncbi:transglutaminase-like domain-containing protein [Marinifilum fragile]|uniref:transglutaminase-like domain-containing protein n=1 Tax=Marinifilum fragile TaxID=570161 RepID=UPI002AA8D2A5|nr:transglutaminase-like domain-containing protein [Marinifilum fragile]